MNAALFNSLLISQSFAFFLIDSGLPCTSWSFSLLLVPQNKSFSSTDWHNIPKIHLLSSIQGSVIFASIIYFTEKLACAMRRSMFCVLRKVRTLRMKWISRSRCLKDSILSLSSNERGSRSTTRTPMACYGMACYESKSLCLRRFLEECTVSTDGMSSFGTCCIFMCDIPGGLSFPYCRPWLEAPSRLYFIGVLHVIWFKFI